MSYVELPNGDRAFKFWRICFVGGPQGQFVTNCNAGEPELNLAATAIRVPLSGADERGRPFTSQRWYPISAVLWWEELTLSEPPPDFFEGPGTRPPFPMA